MPDLPIPPDVQNLREDIGLHISSTAVWRRQKAVDYPDDARNTRAAVLLEELMATVATCPVAVMESYATLCVAPETFEHLIEAESDALRRVGFLIFPESVEELLLGIIAEVSHRAGWPAPR